VRNSYVHCFAQGYFDHAVFALSSNVIHVPSDYATIQDAIDHAVEGSKIFVQAGIYEEAIVISKSLSVIGSGNQSVIKNRGEVNSVEIRAANVTFANFTVDGCGFASTGIYMGNRTNLVENNTIINHRSNGIYLLRASLNVVRNNIVANNSKYGIHIYDSSGNILRDNRLVNNTYNFRVWGLYLGHFVHDVDDSNLVDGKPIYYWINKHRKHVPTNAGCVVIVNSTEITVKNLNVSNNPSGIVMVYTNDSLVWNNNISNSERGLYLISSFHNRILSNRITNNYWAAVSLISSSNNTIASNLIYDSKQGISLSYSPLLSETSRHNDICGNEIRNSQYVGIYFDNANENYVHRNNFDFNSGAIYLVSSNGSRFANNDIVNCSSYGIQIEKASSNTFLLNNFINNILDVKYSVTFQAEHYTNNWDNGTVGNYWSAYEGSDLDGNGIGDVPHNIGNTEIDRFPLINKVSKNKPLLLDFVAVPVDIKVFDTVFFHSSSSGEDGEIMFYLWEIDEVESSRAQQFCTVFQSSGEHNVTLYALDNEGCSSYVKKTIIVRRLITNLTIIAPGKSKIGENISVVALLKDENRYPMNQCVIFLYTVENNTLSIARVAETNASGYAMFILNVDSLPNMHVLAKYEGNAIYADAISDLIITTYQASDDFLVIIFALLFSTALIMALCILWRRHKRRLRLTDASKP
jgi:parallel beta-helix repeat protein